VRGFYTHFRERLPEILQGVGVICLRMLSEYCWPKILLPACWLTLSGGCRSSNERAGDDFGGVVCPWISPWNGVRVWEERNGGATPVRFPLTAENSQFCGAVLAVILRRSPVVSRAGVNRKHCCHYRRLGRSNPSHRIHRRRHCLSSTAGSFLRLRTFSDNRKLSHHHKIRRVSRLMRQNNPHRPSRSLRTSSSLHICSYPSHCCNCRSPSGNQHILLGSISDRNPRLYPASPHMWHRIGRRG